MRLRSAGLILALLAVAACGSGSRATPATTTALDLPATVSTDSFFEEAPVASELSAPTTAAPATTTSTTTSPITTTSTTTTSTTPPPVHDASVCPGTDSSIWDVRPPSSIPAPPTPAGWASDQIGTSALGRPLTAWHRLVDAPARTVLVVGGIHGNEPVSPPTVRSLVGATIPDDVDVWLVPELNADGIAAGTRCNANGVDLNRNFPYAWRSDTGGPGPLSEPEPIAIAALVERLAPDVVVWVHQPYGYVSSIGRTPDAYEQAWAEASGVPVRPNVMQHGGGESWTSFVAGRPSMLIEIDSWNATEEIVAAHRAGFEALLAVVEPL